MIYNVVLNFLPPPSYFFSYHKTIDMQESEPHGSPELVDAERICPTTCAICGLPAKGYHYGVRLLPV